MTETVRTTRLPNGVHVVSRFMPGAKTAALGLWLLNGVRHEESSQSGYAHLLEHVLFKGTGEHDALTLARRFEVMGGQVNAHTGRELTALHGLVPAEHLVELLDLFIAMLLEPRFDEHDMAVEREVVLQEMAMVEDTPEEAVEERATALAWRGHALGRPILGRRESIEAVTAADVHAYLTDLTAGARIWSVAAGAVDHEALVRACARLAELPNGTVPGSAPPSFAPGVCEERRSGAQTHLLWVMRGPPAGEPHYPAWALTNHLLGGGVSSRLFQEVRERRGLVYGIHSALEPYCDAGLWAIQTACEPRHAAACRRAVEDSVAALIERGPAPEELEESRRHLVSGLVLEDDSPEGTMERLAREAIYLNRHPSLNERKAQLAAVEADEVKTILGGAWAQPLTLVWHP
jgi:predicted Zn-dependent peptidase